MSQLPPDHYDDLPEPPAVPMNALGRLSRMLTVLVLASLVPYAVPDWEDYRYWDRLDLEPLRMAARMEAPARNPLSRDPVAVPMAEFAQLPAGPSDSAGEEEGELVAAAEVGAPAEVSPVAGKPLVITDDQLGDQKVWIEGNPHALDGFVQAMQGLAQGTRPYVRIAHFGDSHTANDGITDVTRKLLQRRFGDGGHGFTLVQGRTQWYRHRGVKRTSSEGWKLSNFLAGNGKDGAYGYGGVAVEGGAGEWFQLDSQKHAISHAMLYFRSEGPATLSVKVDGKAVAPLQITAPAGTDGTQDWLLPLAPHTVQWRVTSGRLRLFGGALETDRGVIYDSLGEVGARGTRWIQAKEAHMVGVMAQRSPDLVILNYGGNERIDKITQEQYIEKMEKVVRSFVLVPAVAGKAQPARSCLLIGPGDHGLRKGGKVISDVDIVRIIDWQRKLAKVSGCGFWDARALMGGDGSMGRWVAQGLGWADFAHFSPKGEGAMGLATYRALMQVLRKGSPASLTQVATATPPPSATAPSPAVATSSSRPAMSVTVRVPDGKRQADLRKAKKARDAAKAKREKKKRAKLKHLRHGKHKQASKTTGISRL